jgi:hypothetical protein
MRALFENLYFPGKYSYYKDIGFQAWLNLWLTWILKNQVYVCIVLHDKKNVFFWECRNNFVIEGKDT